MKYGKSRFLSRGFQQKGREGGKKEQTRFLRAGFWEVPREAMRKRKRREGGERKRWEKLEK